MRNSLRVGYLVSADPRLNPSSRFRAFQFLPYLENQYNMCVTGTTMINGQLEPSTAIRNLATLFRIATKTDVMVVQKARLPRPVTWLLTALTRVVYDFDDSTFLPPPSWPEGKSFESRRERLNYCLRRSHLVIAGNEYLAAYARRFSSNVTIIPTVVATKESLPQSNFRWGIPPQVYTARQVKVAERPVIGWIGGGEHVRQLEQVLPALCNLKQNYDFTVRVVSDRQWLPGDLLVENKAWRLEEEVNDVKGFDIGLMPLDENNPFLKGKCAFKAIEYMAVGSPVVASAVGANVDVIRHGETGYLISEPNNWEGYLRRLLENDELRSTLGRNARKWVQELYSVDQVLPRYVELLIRTAKAKKKGK